MTFPTNLGALIARGEGADTLAIIGLDDGFNERRYTFAELDALADAVAYTLAAQYARGERVALLAANSADYVATMLGIMRAGLVAVPVNYKFPRALIADVIADSGARLVFTDSQRVGDAPATLPRVVFGGQEEAPGAQGFQSFIAAEKSHGPTFVPVVPHENEAALFLYTSGSTGRPKGVVLSHASHLWVVETRLKAQPLSGERVLIAAPLYHMNALALVFLTLSARATTVLMPAFNARNYIRAIDTYRCTWLTSVPPMIAMMMQEHELLARTDLSSVRYVRMGSAPVSGALLERTHALLPNATVINAYGTTEGGPVVFGPHPAGLPMPTHAIGAAHRQVELRLIDTNGELASEGELEMRSAGLMNGYHNRPDLATPITPDGFYRTGDVFRRDENDFYTFIGRRDDMFVSGGENIFPGDVEKMLEWHPSIQQASVIPVDDAIKGTKPVAFVVLKPGAQLSAEEVKAFALEHAPAYQHPRQVWFVDAFPLASTNKIDRAVLKREAARRLTEEGNPGKDRGR
ncbi:class I adenylate-forming enzyme family protein [Caballeronia sp. dw_19]|uniref:class I adenylate-forming enzyme family protein n=1 Tax=Caballeronia sp. dw_19 TaxID=2719791 RepID=UPI001BD4A54D|nr:class I adenylate-forming enzyme family protein [Caballeronia sp. dw_19]